MISRLFPKHRTVLIILLVISANLLVVDVLSSYYIFPFTTRIFAGSYSSSMEYEIFSPCYFDIWDPGNDWYFQTDSEESFTSRYETNNSSAWNQYLSEYFGIKAHFRFAGRMEFSDKLVFGPYTYKGQVVVIRLYSISEFDPAKGQQIQLMIAAAALLTGLAVFIITGCQADRSLRGLARMKALLPALGLALLACLDVLWIVRLVNPGCG